MKTKTKRTDQKRLFYQRSIIVTLFILYFSIVIIGFNQIKVNVKAGVANSLETVLATVDESLTLWKQRVGATAEELARDKDLVRLTGELNLIKNLKTSNSREKVKKLRNLLTNKISKNNFKGFFIISSKNKNIATMRDLNLFKENIIYQQRPDLLEKAFQGETVFIPAILSNVELNDSKLKKMSSFMVTPIIEEGKVIGVFSITISPMEEYSRICKMGRLGLSGETYAFDKVGTLLTESRFRNDLVNSGLIPSESSGILNIKIKDPGENLILKNTQINSQDNFPLTLMAESAIHGNSGSNTEGYRDYRGVKVYGSWLWNEDLHLGITTEIDAEEADKPIHLTRNVLYLISIVLFGITLIAIFIIWKLNNSVETELQDRVKEKTLELENANELKEKFFGLIAHDLRSPIGNVSNILKEANNGNIELEGKILKIIAQSASSSYYLLEDLLTWTFSQKSELKVNMEKFDLNLLVQEVKEFYNTLLHSRKISLIIEGDLEVNMVNADYRLINTVLRNFMSNAIKFSATDSKIILRTSKENGKLKVEIQDFGNGISEDKVKNLFEFEKNKSTEGQMGERGSGLGLPMCKEFIEKNNGEIVVVSKLGFGTTMSFTMLLC